MTETKPKRGLETDFWPKTTLGQANPSSTWFDLNATQIRIKQNDNVILVYYVHFQYNCLHVNSKIQSWI